MLSSDDQKELLEAAYQIIDSSISARNIFEEACSLSKKLKSEKSTTRGHETSEVEKFLSCTCASSMPSFDGIENTVITSPNLARQIVEISRSAVLEEDQLLDERSRDRLRICIGLIKQCSSRLNQEVFASYIHKHDLPLEVIWNLHKGKIFKLDALLTNKLQREERFKFRLARGLVKSCKGTPQTQPLRQEILSGFMCYLFRKGFVEKTSVSQIHRAILDSIVTDCLGLSVSSSEEICLALPTQFLDVEEVAQEDAVHKFAAHSVSLILSHNAVEQIEEAVKSPKDWKLVRVSDTLQQMLNQLFLHMKCQDLFSILQRSVEKKELNSLHLFAYLSALITNFSEATSSIADYLRELICDALEMHDSIKMHRVFFIVDLCSSIGSHCFPNFAEWFQNTFGSPSSVTLTKSSCTFFLKFLTSRIPWESAERLKVYILKKPTVPLKCKSQLEDLIVLAKTRLADLGVPLFEQTKSLFETNNKSDDCKKVHQDPVEQDVEKVIVSFSETRKLPTVLVEASIFRRPYFVGKFLPVLLKPRVLPDEPDERMLLIEEVNKSGKIPVSLYNRYRQECETEKEQLFQGVFDVDEDDEDMHELSLPVFEQLKKKLDKYAKTVLSGDLNMIRGCLNDVVDKVSVILIGNARKVSSLPDNTDVVFVDLTKTLNLPLDILDKVSLLLLECLSQLVTQWRDQKAGEENALLECIQIYQPIHTFVEVILQKYTQLRTSFYSTVMACLVRTKDEAAMNSSASCLPLVVLSFACLPYILSTSRDCKSGSDGCEPQRFINILASQNNLLSSNMSVLRFYLEYVYVACRQLTTHQNQLDQHSIVEVSSDALEKDNLIPSELVKKVRYSSKRYRYTSQYTETPSSPISQILAALSMEPTWEQMIKDNELSIDKWVEMELMIDTKDDCLLPENRDAYFWDMSSMFLKQHGMTSFCSSVLLSLAQQWNSGKRGQHGAANFGGPTTVGNLLKILQKLLTRLPERQLESETFLHNVLEATTSPEIMIKLFLELPAFLLFSDSYGEDEGKTSVSSALKFVKSLIGSSEIRGAHFSLKATLYILQAVENVCKSHSLEQINRVSPVILHPIVFTSVLVHKVVLDSLGALDLCRPVSTTWQKHILKALELCDELSKVEIEIDSCRLENWQKAAVLYSRFQHKSKTHSMKISEFNRGIQHHLVEMFIAHLTNLGSWDEVQNPADGTIPTLILETFAAQPAILIDILGSKDIQQVSIMSFRSQLGMDVQPWMTNFRDLIILRLAMQVSPTSLMQSQPRFLTANVVSTYCRILSHAQEEETYEFEAFQSELSKWIRSLIDLTSHQELSNICEIPQKLCHLDVLLCKYIQEKKMLTKCL